MVRPVLSQESFLRHLFSPAKHKLPTGIKHTKLVGVRGGRSRLRLAAFNRMSARNQEVLRQAGMRDKYLTGDATLADAKRQLRLIAFHKGYRKPRRTPVTPTSNLDAANAGHLYRAMSMAHKPVDERAIRRNISHLPAGMKPDFQKWSDTQIRAYASDDENLVPVGGRMINPVWYHPSNR